jgi:ParB family chromosome partitioning protein
VSTVKKHSGLGKGFDVLLPQNFDETLLLSAADKVEKIHIDKLVANRYQPRQDFDDEAIRQLAGSIKKYGVLQPLVVSILDDGTYMIIAGERRWRASRIAGLERVPAIVRSTQQLERLEIALIENMQRVDLSPLEQAASIEYLHKNFNVNYDVIAEQLNKATTTVHNIVRLLQLPERAYKSLQKKLITEGHARAILALKDYPEKQDILLNNIQSHGWSVRQAEQFVTSLKEGFQESKAAQKRMENETPETKRLSKKIGVPVQIRRMAKGGKLEITFKSDEELQKIVEILS